MSPNSKMLKKTHPKMITTEDIVLWRHPIVTLEYFTKSLQYFATLGIKRLAKSKKVVLGAASFVFLTYTLAQINGPHRRILMESWNIILFCVYWCALGVISSVGMGWGLHTFLLYLGPHIASVTLAAYECNSLNFPSPPYPDEITCPEEADGNVNYATIMAKVRLESMMWGLGTALGELSSYFLARAHRLCGEDTPTLDIEPEDSRMARARNFVIKMINKSRFVAILILASVPNPLFDFAGMACGRFLVPFWGFFLPTLIGKAVIKTHLQILFVIAVFNDVYLESCLTWIANYVPVFGTRLQKPIRDLIENKRLQFKNRTVEKTMLATVIDFVVAVMIFYFLATIVNAMAQSHHKRLKDKK